MFAKQRQRLPEVGTIQVGDMVLTDAKALRRQEYAEGELEPIRKAWTRLQAWVAPRHDLTKICGHGGDVQGRYDLAFDRWSASNTDATTDDFDLVYQPDYDDSDADPRLASIHFTVSVDGEFTGLFQLWNIKIHSGPFIEFESNPPRAIRDVTISATPGPAFHSPRGFIDTGDTAAIMDALLKRNVLFKGTDHELDLVAWNLGTRDDRAWVDKPGQPPWCSVVLDLLSEHERIDVQRDGETIPKTINRRTQ